MTEHGKSGGQAVVIGADRPFGAEIMTALDRAGFRTGALIVNAPVELDQLRFADIADDGFRAALDAQLYTMTAAVQAAAGRLVRGTSIVHVASRAHLGGWGGAHQMAAGAAAIAMARSLALEFAGAGVRVNCLAPDFVGGPWDTPEARRALAETVVFLASPASRLISGETILLDEGRSLRMAEAARR